MKKLLSLTLALFVFFNCFCFVTFAEDTAAENNTDFAVKAAEIIKNDDNEAEMLRIIGRLRSDAAKIDFPYISDCVVSDDGRFVLQFSTEAELLACLEKLNKNSDIIYAERDCLIHTEALEETDEYLSWGVEAIEADIYSQKIAPTASGRSVTVAIVDSGCEDIDFIKDKLVDGYDFVENDSDAAQDESVDSHGTFLASIVTDCTRTLPVKIMPVRVLSSEEGSLINVVNGIMYAADNGADVINISLGAILNNCKPLEDAVNYAESKNVSVVVCAGNAKIDIKNYCPAHNSNAITVSSVNMNEEFSASFSNFGSEIDLAAPGEIIIGYDASGNEAVLSGTSMSAAFVSAAAAMFRLEKPQCNTNQVRKAIISSTEDRGDKGWDSLYGHGMLKLSKLALSDDIPVESISFSQDAYEFFIGDSLEIKPVITPENATNKGFTLSVFGDNISINGNVITAVSAGISTLTVTSNDGAYSHKAQITVKEKAPEIQAVLKIKNNFGEKIINYGETLRLSAETTNKPENTTVWWFVDGIKSGEGNTFEVAPKNGSVWVTAKLVNADGTVVKDIDGKEISDSQAVTAKSGFFQKLISFFKNLFRLNRTVVQSFIR